MTAGRGAMTGAPIADRVTSRLTEFGLVTAHELVPRSAQTSLIDTLPIVLELLDLEAVKRRQKAGLSVSAAMHGCRPATSINCTPSPPGVSQTATDVLAFGLPGAGKSHALCGVGHVLVDRGHRVPFIQAYALRTVGASAFALAHP